MVVRGGDRGGKCVRGGHEGMGGGARGWAVPELVGRVWASAGVQGDGWAVYASGGLGHRKNQQSDY